MPEVKFGVLLDPIYLPLTYSSCKSIALESERLGFNAVWMSDHLMVRKEPILECFTVLSTLSSITSKIRLGSLVFCNSYRYPSLLAKMAATLDVASEGRLEFGIGAGWNEGEYNAYGVPFPKASVRISQLREGIEVIKKMWTEEKATYQGKYFKIKDAFCEPKPVQKPHPPITIGGGGEKLTLRVVAKYADRYNWGICPVETLRRKLKLLEEHCSAVHRDYDQIEKSLITRVIISESKAEVGELAKKRFNVKRPAASFKEWFENFKASNIVGTPSECLDKVKDYIDTGVTYFMPNFCDSPSMEGMRLFAEEVIKNL